MFEQNVITGPGTGTFTTHTFEIFLMLGVAFLLGLWLGWVLWSRYRQMAEKMRFEQDSLNATANALRTENDNLKSRVATVEAEKMDVSGQLTGIISENKILLSQLESLETELLRLTDSNRNLSIRLGLSAEPEPVPEPAIEITNELPAEPEPEIEPEPEQEPFVTATEPELGAPDTSGFYGDDSQLANAASAEILNNLAQDDLELNALAALHQTHGGAALPGLSDDADDPIADGIGLDDEGLLGPIAEPESEWITEPVPEIRTPITAAEPEPQPEPEPVVATAPSPVEEVAGTDFNYIVMAGPHDDLKIVEGIGPKIEELLFKNGIHTYTELARTPVNHLKDILQEAGPRFALHDPGTWSAQALLAANGEWDNLKAYQEFLNAGKKPK